MAKYEGDKNNRKIDFSKIKLFPKGSEKYAFLADKQGVKVLDVSNMKNWVNNE